MRITLDLLRRRSEHNEKVLSTLKEITLHQFEIERIELIDNVCRELQILYLQNNVISKIENLSRLVELAYLQLALNNISVIENLEHCEALSKLDLTCNFVEDPSCVASLQANTNLRSLFLVGNPLAAYPMYREYILSLLPQLTVLDGIDVSKEEVIVAAQVAQQAAASVAEAYAQRLAAREAGELNEMTPEERSEIYAEVEAEKAEKEAARNPFPIEKKAPREVPIYKPDGSVYQCNWGKYKFKLAEDEVAREFVLEVKLGKHLDTSLIDADVQPDYVRVTIKGQVLQLALAHEVAVDASSAQRSQATGNLVLIMPWVAAKDDDLFLGTPSASASSFSSTPPADDKGPRKLAKGRKKKGGRAGAKRRAARRARIVAGTATEFDLYEDKYSSGSAGSGDRDGDEVVGSGLKPLTASDTLDMFGAPGSSQGDGAGGAGVGMGVGMGMGMGMGRMG